MSSEALAQPQPAETAASSILFSKQLISIKCPCGHSPFGELGEAKLSFSMICARAAEGFCFPDFLPDKMVCRLLALL